MNSRSISAQAIIKLSFIVISLFALVTGCGGGGGGGAAAPTYSISGTVSGDTLAGVTINLTGAATASTTTAADGKFSFTGLANGTYQVTAVKASYRFNPLSLVIVVSGANVTNTDFAAINTGGASTYSLSGTVSGVVQAGVLMTLSGTGSPSFTTTDASGTYSFPPGLVNGDYTVTPSRTGYIFTPANRIVSVSGSNSTGNNFSSALAPEPTYKISGNVSGAIKEGVAIQLTGAATASTTTDADGNYSFSMHNGIYTVTPFKAGYTFNPTSTAVTINGADQAGKNFVATKVPEMFTISGTVSGDALGGVTITLSGGASGSTTTNASGNYSFSNVVEGSNCTVTPSAPGYTFTPGSRDVTVTGNITVGDFVAAAKPSVTWKEYMLKTSASSTAGWRRRTLKFADANPGILFSAASCLDSSGSTTCPAAGSLTWNNSVGVISESGAGADSNVHMTITSTGNFIAGTGNSAGDSYSQLRVALEVVPGTVYDTINDLRNKSFVFHEMIVGSVTKWRYGRGSTDGTGAVTLTSQIEPSGATTPDTWGTLNVAPSGVVTISGISEFSGFLANDKKTIVGTYTSGTTFRLMIIQITARNDYPAGLLPESIWASSILAKSTSIPVLGVQAGWVYCTNAVDSSGNMSFGTDWTSDNSQFQSRRPTTSYTGSLSSSGIVTMAGSDYHGQASDDWNFLAGTMTMPVSTSYVYFLQISTR